MKLRKRNKLLSGVGINDANYNVYEYTVVEGKTKMIWCCPFYKTWGSMLVRCYSPKYQKLYPTYIGCSVTKEWHLFSNFKAWMEAQDWKGKHLDKDILFRGNKTYSPEACVFVDPRINTFLSENGAVRGEYPIGVCFHKRDEKYTAKCCSAESGKRKHLGYFDTAEEAHEAWLVFKLEQAKILASEQSDERIAKALIERYENYDY